MASWDVIFSLHFQAVFEAGFLQNGLFRGDNIGNGFGCVANSAGNFVRSNSYSIFT